MDSRLARLAQTQSSTSSARGRRRIYEAEVVEDQSAQLELDNLQQGDILEGDNPFLQKLEEQEENEEDIAARRQRVRARLASKKQELETVSQAPTGTGGIVSMAERMAKKEEESSEYETETDETDSEDESNSKLLKPLFISRQYRQTLRQQEEEEKLQELKKQQEILQREERKQQTRVLVAESIKKQNEIDAMKDVTDNDSDAGLPDDVDYDDQEEEEYNAWKIREMFRMKRETEQREQMIREAKDIERRRNMTDEERYQEDLKLGRFEEKEKKKWKFLQKYYHKGVFYMDEDSIQKKGIQSQYGINTNDKETEEKKVDARLRDYDEPTLEDKFNKESLPAILQVKKFGLRGRTKYTHLVDQDTTDFMQPLKPDERVKSNYMAKRAGMGDLNLRKKRSKIE